MFSVHWCQWCKLQLSTSRESKYCNSAQTLDLRSKLPTYPQWLCIPKSKRLWIKSELKPRDYHRFEPPNKIKYLQSQPLVIASLPTNYHVTSLLEMHLSMQYPPSYVLANFSSGSPQNFPLHKPACPCLLCERSDAWMGMQPDLHTVVARGSVTWLEKMLNWKISTEIFPPSQGGQIFYHLSKEVLL